MDIQVVLYYFAVITYITYYYAKDDTGTLEVIKAALAQTDTKDLKEKIKQAELGVPHSEIQVELD